MPFPTDPEKQKLMHAKASATQKGKIPWNKGIHWMSQEQKDAVSRVHKGKTNSPEARMKMSIARKGVPKSPEHKKAIGDARRGKSYPNCARVRSPEWKESASKRMMGNTLGKGDKNGRWKGGSSFFPYCPKFNFSFKEKVREFFNNTCVSCGKTRDLERNRKRLAVHHVYTEKMACCETNIEEMESVRKRFPPGVARHGDLNFSEKEIMHIRMMVPLCMSCHSKTMNEPNDISYDQSVYRKMFTEIIISSYNGKCY